MVVFVQLCISLPQWSRARLALSLGLALGLSHAGLGCKASPKREQTQPVPAKTPASEPPSPPPKAAPEPAKPAAPSGAATPAPTAKSAPGRAGNIGKLKFVERIFNPGQQTELPVLVMIHGLGDKPAHFFRFGDPLTSPHRALALQGIHQYSGSFGNGFAWFLTRVKDRKIKKLAQEINHAASVVAKGLVALNKKEHKPHRKYLVTGFSQGGILSYALAIQYPELIEAAVPISGLLPAPARKIKGDTRPKIIAFHGEADRIVPFERAQTLGTWLKKQGFDYELKSYPEVGHRIPQPMYEPLLKTLDQLLARKATP